MAAFHASLTHRGEAILDMTAGLGIDAMTMYRAGASVSACEIDSLKAAALLHNAGVSGAAGLRVINIDSRVILSEPDSRYDVIFIDPARRDRLNGRTYAFSDCEPDVTAMSTEYMLSVSLVNVRNCFSRYPAVMTVRPPPATKFPVQP